jgi:hypothetical protein
MIAFEDTEWYLSSEVLGNEPQRSLSALFHFIRESKVSVKMSLFKTVKVPEVAGKL